jgi:hypothetical protein
MDAESIELKDYLTHKRKSKRRSSIANCDAHKILSK